MKLFIVTVLLWVSGNIFLQLSGFYFKMTLQLGSAFELGYWILGVALFTTVYQLQKRRWDE